METIRCRNHRNLWWMVPLGVLECGFMAVAPFLIAREQPASSPWPIYLICGPAAIGFFYCVIWMVRSLLYEEVIADDQGLRWRGVFGPWKGARWEEISDFDLRKIKREPTIETPQGKLVLSSTLVNRAVLMSFIAERAVNAPSREWEVFEFRASQNFSRRFDYWTKSQIWTAPILSLSAVYVFAFLGWSIFVGKSTASGRYQLSWSFDALSILMILVRLGPIIALFVIAVPLMWRERNSAYNHRDEHLEISPRGVAWQNGETRIEANWEEVRAVHSLPGRGFKRDYRVETQNGDFTVWKELENLNLWIELVRQFAPHLSIETPVVDPDLGSEAATWSGGQIGNGARIFHFRIRDTRLALWAATVFVVVLPLFPILMHAMQTPDDDPSPLPWKFWAAVLILGVLVLSYLWLCFKRAAIWADETALEWRVPFFKTRRIIWNEIESFGRDEGGNFLIARGQKTRLWRISAPARQVELLQLIAERATNASGKWD